jgi:hypothetical protein
MGDVGMRDGGRIAVREHARHFNEGFAIRGTPLTAWQMVAAIIEQKGWKKQKFCSMTLLDEYVFDRAMSNYRKKPGLRTLMAFSAGADLDIEATEVLLQAIGTRLDNSKEGRAFDYIIRKMPGYSIHERNEVLRLLGIEPLGSGSKED